ncbi:MAG: glycosyltransferase family 4 protein [Bacteroidales bacterium]
MKILMVLTEEFPPDDRVEKEALALIERGHEIIIACQTLKKIKRQEIYKKIIIERLYMSRLMYKLSVAALIVPFYFTFWYNFLKRLHKKYQFDVVHVHDLPLTKVGNQLSRKYGLKLVCDQHEFYSNWIVHTAHMNKGIGKIINLLSNWKKYEKKYLKKADLVITIEEPLRKNYIEHAGIKPEKIILVPNTPSKKVFNEQNVKTSIKEKYKDNFVLFYAGGIDILRGINIIIESLPVIKKHIPEIKFIFAGIIRKGCDPVKLAKKLKVEDNIEFLGWIDIQEIPSYINASDICLHVPPVIRDETNLTIATKIFQYIAMEKPVIVGQAKLMKKLVTENNLGLAIKDNDHKDLADKIIHLYNNPDVLQNFSYNCKKIKSQFIWEVTIKNLIQFYDQ